MLLDCAETKLINSEFKKLDEVKNTHNFIDMRDS